MMDVTFREAGLVESRMATPEELAETEARVSSKYYLEDEIERKKHMRRKVTPEMVADINRLCAEGQEQKQVAQTLGVSPATVARHRDTRPQPQPAAGSPTVVSRPASGAIEREIETLKWVVTLLVEALSRR
ncbi:MAG: hypothetical protein LBS45_12275 [Synergistaceae bacterium]|jgi:DNA-binding CsgD family transcriptional regulator|nr:hypothetical protein [Synergistaceae bacterium]